MTTDNASRQPKGIPAGGQFAATTHQEPTISLTPSGPPLDELTALPAQELEPAPPAPPAAPVKFAETQRKIRGHNFYAPKAVLSKVPALGATEDIPFEEKKFHLHYFAGGAANWYIAEVDPATGRAFGLMDPSGRGDGSWGYVSLPELEAVNLGGYRVVERDCYFSHGNLAHVSRHR